MHFVVSSFDVLDTYIDSIVLPLQQNLLFTELIFRNKSVRDAHCEIIMHEVKIVWFSVHFNLTYNVCFLPKNGFNL